VFVLRVAAYVSLRPALVAANLAETLLDLRGDFERERVQALREITDIAQKIIVEDDGGDGSKKSRGGGDESFGNAWCHGSKAGGASGPEAGEGVNDAPNSAEEPDEGSDGTGGGEPGHAFFHATNFFSGCKLHVDGNGAQTFEPGRFRISRMGSHLELEFAVAGGIDVGKWRTGRGECLRIRNASRCTKNAEKLVALTANAAEQAELLKNHSPGNNGKEEKQCQDGASYPTGLFKNAAEIGGEGCDQEKRNVEPLSLSKFAGR
jgi:hypothetical protein